MKTDIKQLVLPPVLITWLALAWGGSANAASANAASADLSLSASTQAFEYATVDKLT